MRGAPVPIYVPTREQPVIRPRLALAILLLGGGPALAQSTQVDRDRLAVLHRVAVLREICDFPLSDAERARLTETTERLKTRTATTEGEAAAGRETVKKRVESERTAETCDRGGAVFQVYRVTLDGLESSN